MAKMTPQQIADAARKRAATQAANRAAGIPTVRQQRAAARAAKAARSSSSYAPPPPRATYAPPPPRPRQTWTPPPPPPPRPAQPTASAPLFSAPVVTVRGAKLVALAAFEDVVKATFAKGGITDAARADWATYKKLKSSAMQTAATPEMQNEADTALRMAITRLLKLAF
jgi:hypothetical protein